jgi:hypothetical protein
MDSTGNSVAVEVLSGDIAGGADMQPAVQHRRMMAAMMMAWVGNVMGGHQECSFSFFCVCHALAGFC